jgi:hypothetical protein
MKKKYVTRKMVKDYNVPKNMLMIDFIQWKILNDTISRFKAEGLPVRDVDYADRFWIVAKYYELNKLGQ